MVKIYVPFLCSLCVGPEPNLELNLGNFGAAADDCFLGLTLAVNTSAPNLGETFFFFFH